MSKPNNVKNLPKPLLEALISRLRESNYTPIDVHLDWLKAQGDTTVSRSGMARFIVHLRAVDSRNGDLVAKVFERRSRLNKAASKAQNRLIEISRHLANLGAKQAALTVELTALAAETPIDAAT